MGGAESSKRMLGMLIGSQAETMMKASFASWQETVHGMKMDRIREGAAKMRSKEQESQRRMLTMLMGSQDSLLVKTSFSGWSECIYELRQMREVEQMSRDMKSKGDESTKRMLGMLMGAQAEVLVKAAFAGWHDLAVDAHFAKMRDTMKAKGEEGTRRMLAMLLGSQAELMQKAMFTGWRDYLIDLKRQREVDRIKSGMKSKGDESTKRMLAMLMGSQMDVLKKASFAGWWEHLVEEKQHNEMRKLQQSMRAKGAESNKRMLGMLLGAQAETMLKASFAGWSELVYHAKMDRLREDKLKRRSKEDESRRRMLGMLVGSQSNLVMKIAFTGWSDSHYEAKKLREVEKMRRQMKSKGDESTKRMLGMLMSSQGEALLKAVLSGWHETAVASHIARMRDDLSHLKSKKEEGTKRMLGMLLGSQAELMEKASFSAWHELISVLKKDREVERMKAGLKSKGEESTKRMLAMLMGSQEEVLKKAAYAGWHEYVVEEKQHNEMRKLQQSMRAKGAESNKRMLGMLLGAQAETVVKASFAGWSELVYHAKMDRLREDKLKMRSKEDESRRRMLGML